MVEVDGTSVEVSHIWDAATPWAPGKSADEIVIVRAVASGAATIRLDQRRTWAGDGKSGANLYVHVAVLPADGNDRSPSA